MNATNSEYKFWLRSLDVGDQVAWKASGVWHVAAVAQRSDHGWLRLRGGGTVNRDGLLWRRGVRQRVFPTYYAPAPAEPPPKPRKPGNKDLLQFAMQKLRVTETELARQYARAQ